MVALKMPLLLSAAPTSIQALSGPKASGRHATVHGTRCLQHCDINYHRRSQRYLCSSYRAALICINKLVYLLQAIFLAAAIFVNARNMSYCVSLLVF